MKKELEILNEIEQAEEKIKSSWDKLSYIANYNHKKVLQAFIDNNIGTHHLEGTTGYGFNDLGRETLEKLVSQIFKSEASLVRPHFASGTHTISCVLFGILRPGDELLSVVGKPYDTLEEVIGVRGKGYGSLADWGISYKVLPLTYDNTVDYDKLPDFINKKTKLVLIQRSRGYDLRPSVNIKEIKKIIQYVKQIKSDTICFVDNCYGEFCETEEPIEVGADIIAGSFIKNFGGGITPQGGYITGKSELVFKAGNRLYTPGMGAKVGATLGFNRAAFLGIFLAPHVVEEALKGAILASYIFEKRGYKVSPRWDEYRTDIVQAICLNNPELVKKFCWSIQKSSPIDSYLQPIPEKIDGYNDKVIMAGGTFTEGSSIELSADGPLREPYAVYLQAGISYRYLRIALIKVLKNLYE